MSESVKQDVKQGLAWSAIGKLLTQLFSWTATFFVIKILTPNDYGIIEICIAFLSLSFILSEGGLSDAVVRYKDLAPSFLNEVFSASLLLNLFIYAVIWLSAPFIAAFFDSTELIGALRVVAIQLPITSLFVVPLGKFRAAMNFKKIAIVDGFSSIVNAAVALSCAIAGFEYWSLVYGGIAGAVVKAFMLNWRFGSTYYFTIRFKLLKISAKFSSLTVVNRLMWLTYTKFDVVIIGKFLGTILLGFYSVAMQVAALPLMKVGAIINQVSFSAYSKVSQDEKQIRYYYSLSNKLLALISFPLFFGISAIAADFVPLVLGEKWNSAIIPMQILSVIVPFRVLALAKQAMFQGIGKPEVNTKNLVVAIIALPVAITIGTQYGLVGASFGWGIGFLVFFGFTAAKTIKYLNIKTSEYLRDIFTPIWASTTMLVVLIYSDLDQFFDNGFILLFAKVILGAAIYSSVLILFGKDRYIKPLFAMLKK